MSGKKRMREESESESEPSDSDSSSSSSSSSDDESSDEQRHAEDENDNSVSVKPPPKKKQKLPEPKTTNAATATAAATDKPPKSKKPSLTAKEKAFKKQVLIDACLRVTLDPKAVETDLKLISQHAPRGSGKAMKKLLAVLQNAAENNKVYSTVLAQLLNEKAKMSEIKDIAAAVLAPGGVLSDAVIKKHGMSSGKSKGDGRAGKGGLMSSEAFDPAQIDFYKCFRESGLDAKDFKASLCKMCKKNVACAILIPCGCTHLCLDCAREWKQKQLVKAVRCTCPHKKNYETACVCPGAMCTNCKSTNFVRDYHHILPYSRCEKPSNKLFHSLLRALEDMK